ncbi:rhomboid family intramembrane serine protease, partial [Staphylococcus hominis]
MNIDKLYWKSIYYWIKYFNYKLEHTDKNTNEIWLSNKKKEELIVFRKEVSSTQEIR